MSLLESLSISLATMGFAQLGLAWLAALGYSLSLSGSLGARARLLSAGAALAGAAGFAVLTPSWTSGVVLMGLGVVTLAAFAAVVWLLATLLGLDSAHEPASSPSATPTHFSATRPLTSNVPLANH